MEYRGRTSRFHHEKNKRFILEQKILFCQETNVLMIEKKRKKIFHCKKKNI